jgi:hypothetical protein
MLALTRFRLPTPSPPSLEELAWPDGDSAPAYVIENGGYA